MDPSHDRPSPSPSGPREPPPHPARRRVDLPIDPDLTPSDSAEPGPRHVAGAPATSRLSPRTLGAVWIGGALGTLARYLVSKTWSAPTDGFPTAIFVINTSGAFCLGLLLTVLLERLPHRAAVLRPLLATGVLGGWTTFSTLVVGADGLVRAGAAAMALGYLGATLVAGLVGTASGIWLGRVAPGVAVVDEGAP